MKPLNCQQYDSLITTMYITSFNILQKLQQYGGVDPNKRQFIPDAESSFDEQSERQIYYYSKFDLFGSASEDQFYQFSIFGERVSAELGADWATEAGMLYYPFLSSKQIFLHLLELWLRSHPPVNSMRTVYNKTSTFNSQFVSDFDSLIRSIIPTTATVKPAPSSLRAVCLGFYMTANQIWQELFQPIPERKQLHFGGGFLRGVTNTIEKTFKPLMVVTQRISNVFGHKRRKLNEGQQLEKCDQAQFEDCYHEFRRALDIGKQLERKMSDFCIDDVEIQSQRRQVEQKEFVEEESPLQPTLVSTLYNYVTDFLHRNPSWQIASNFVTQILDLNQVTMEEGKKVKVLRPAQDFYRKLVMAWLLLCKQNTVPFDDYLSVLRSTFFAGDWQSRFIIPTRYFFEKMKGNWQKIKQEGGELNEKSVLSAFLSRVKGCMSEDWNHKMAIKRV